MLLSNKYTMRLVSAVVSINVLAWSYQVQASTLTRGGISFLQKCPGDEVKAKPEDGIRFFGNIIPALLTPLITGAVDFALKSTGERLSKAAEEEQADSLHKGSYFYVRKQGPDPDNPDSSEELYWDQKSWCLVVASKATKATDNTVTNLVEGYAGYTFEIDTKTRKRSYLPESSYPEAKTDLVNELEKLGFKGKTTPGLIAVFDFEVSDQGDTFRLLPRFVATDHSIREKKVDGRSRDISFEFKFAIPGNPPKGLNVPVPLIKIEGLKINQPFINNLENPTLTSHWITRPENDAKNPLENIAAKNISQDFVGKQGRTFDLTIDIKEFRKRPIAKFLGQLLSDGTKREQLVTPIVTVIDPATRQAAQAKKENTQIQLKIALSALIDAAEEARRDYEQANPGADKQSKMDMWRSKQRTANLKAWEAGIKIPYPDAGFFRTNAPSQEN